MKVYFKQYGMQRTGTNYLKCLMERNFVGVHVFPSVFGWKHGRAVSPENWLASASRPDGSVVSVDGHKLRYTRAQLEAVLAQGPLRYVVSIKDPYGFIYSFKRFRAPRKDWKDVPVKQWCSTFNQRYLGWHRFMSHEDAAWVRYEDLIQDFASVLKRLQQTFGLVPVGTEFSNETRVVMPSTDLGLLFGRERFDPSFYIERKYLQALPDSTFKVVSDSIDWDLMKRHGYRREER